MKVLSFNYKKKQFTLSNGKKKEVISIKNLADADLVLLEIISNNSQLLYSSSINQFCYEMEKHGYDFAWTWQETIINVKLLNKKGKFYYRETKNGKFELKKEGLFFRMTKYIEDPPNSKKN